MGVGVKENQEGLEGGGDRKMIPTLLPKEIIGRAAITKGVRRDWRHG
jgi:hypothetical protein